VFNNHQWCDSSWCRYKDGVPVTNPGKVDEDIVNITTVAGASLPDDEDPHHKQNEYPFSQENGSSPPGNGLETENTDTK
jgi:hypothetical protein